MVRYVLRKKSYVVFDAATEAARDHGSNGGADVGAARVVTGSSEGGTRLRCLTPVVMMFWNSELCVRSWRHDKVQSPWFRSISGLVFTDASWQGSIKGLWFEEVKMAIFSWPSLGNISSTWWIAASSTSLVQLLIFYINMMGVVHHIHRHSPSQRSLDVWRHDGAWLLFLPLDHVLISPGVSFLNQMRLRAIVRLRFPKLLVNSLLLTMAHISRIWFVICRSSLVFGIFYFFFITRNFGT